MLAGALTGAVNAQSSAERSATSDSAAAGAPVRLAQPTQGPRVDAGSALAARSPDTAAYVPGEFEQYVQGQAGERVEVRRFGAELISGSGDARSAELSPVVPSDYVIAAGDEVLVTLWGSVDADLRLMVDRGGRVTIPRIGAVQVGGVRYADLQDVISRRVAQVFRNFQISVSMGQLRGIRVFVTGFVVSPGTYTVSSLSTLVGALMRAGGPAASGSFRSVELRRGGQVISAFDLYDLLLKGDRSSDRILQAGDVVHVGPVGVQVGVIGSVNKPVVVELKPGELVRDALRIAGGFSAVADRTRLSIERLQDRLSARVAQLDLPAGLDMTLSHGDLLRAFSSVGVALPTTRQQKRVRVEGEVARPSEYVLPEGSSISDALRAAGGFTERAFIYATEFNRESVRVTQQENYERALRDLETEFARSTSSRRVTSGEEAAGLTARSTAANRLLDRLRTLRPSGRIVLQMGSDSTELPDLALEDGDRIFVPARPTTVGVFGSVFNAASYLHLPGRSLSDYLQLAGGPTRGADNRSIFVVRANGHVISNLQSSAWYRAGNSVETTLALPGDTVFVPEEMDKTTFVQSAKDWTLFLYQLGIGVAGLKSATR